MLGFRREERSIEESGQGFFAMELLMSILRGKSQAESLETATLVRVVPKKNKGKGEIVPLNKKKVRAFADANILPWDLRGGKLNHFIDHTDPRIK